MPGQDQRYFRWVQNLTASGIDGQLGDLGQWIPLTDDEKIVRDAREEVDRIAPGITEDVK